MQRVDHQTGIAEIQSSILTRGKFLLNFLLSHWQIPGRHKGCTPQSIFFIFMQFLAKILSNNRFSLETRVWASPPLCPYVSLQCQLCAFQNLQFQPFRPTRKELLKTHWQFRPSVVLTFDIGGSKGAPETPPGQNSFISMQFSARNLQNNLNLGVGTLPLGKSWIRHCLMIRFKP